MPDEIKADGSSPSEEVKSDESLKAAGQETETPKGEESEKAVPYSRFQEVNQRMKDAESRAKEYESVLAGYQQEFGVIRTEEDLKQWREYKTKVLKGAREAEEEGDISPKRLAEIRKVMRKADPEYVEMLSMKQRFQQQDQERLDAQFDDAEEIVRELAAEEYGFKSELDENGQWKSKHEEDLSDIGVDVMQAIRRDQRLTRLWNNGNVDRAVRRAFQAVKAKHERLGKTVTQLKQEAAERKRVLPTLHGGRGTLSARTSERKSKGLNGPEATKELRDEAWAVFNNSLQQ